MIKKYEEDFNRKIDCFIHHPSYNELRKQADTALRFHTGCVIEAIKAQDFMDRIVAMPLDYIEGWLNHTNLLAWRPIDKKYLQAYKYGALAVFEKYPNFSYIVKIGKNLRKKYEGFGFEIFVECPEQPDYLFAVTITKEEI